MCPLTLTAQLAKRLAYYLRGTFIRKVEIADLFDSQLGRLFWIDFLKRLGSFATSEGIAVFQRNEP